MCPHVEKYLQLRWLHYRKYDGVKLEKLQEEGYEKYYGKVM